MTALGAFGLFCIILVCFSLPVILITDVYKKPQAKKYKNEKRLLNINRTHYWDYLIVILPVWLLLIILFSSNIEEQVTSVVIVSWGYTYLIVSSYNRRIDIFRIKIMLLITCLCTLCTGIYLQFFTNFYDIGDKVQFLYVQFAALLYILISRKTIYLITGSYPITLDKYFRVGFYFSRY